jgi:hypothetical protein
MFRFTMTAILTALLFAASHAQNKSIELENLGTRCLNPSFWKLYTAPLENNEKFSILLPESPQRRGTFYYGEKAAESFYKAKCGWNLEFHVMSIEIDKVDCLRSRSSKSNEKCLDEFAKTYKDEFLMDDLPDYGEKRMIFQQDSDLGGYQGKQYTLSIPEYRYLNGNPGKDNIIFVKELLGIVRIYKAKSHYYAVKVIGDNESNPLVKNFFDSFLITNEN